LGGEDVDVDVNSYFFRIEDEVDVVIYYPRVEMMLMMKRTMLLMKETAKHQQFEPVQRKEMLDKPDVLLSSDFI
jgi:hypothetical protein